MILEKTGYSYNDLTIVPETVTHIAHRSECNVYDQNGMLPLFTAPMSCIINEHNYKIWEHYKINTIIPRTVPYKKRIQLLYNNRWVALSLEEFRKLFCYNLTQDIDESHKFKVCIDLANGHMQKLYDTIVEAKRISKCKGYSLTIMTGNIANPYTYEYIITSHVPIDYIRLSIGSGHVCLTSSNTGVHYPIGTLIDECAKIKHKYEVYYYDDLYTLPKIVADGGIRNYKDINIALALGADYVMVGSVFASIAESASPIYINNYEKEIQLQSYIDDEIDAIGDENKMQHLDFVLKTLINSQTNPKKKFFGMSTPEAQAEINNALEHPLEFSKKTSEGLAKMIDCKYTLRQWVENFIDYLRSAMSYTDSPNIEWFSRYTNLIINSTQTVGSVNK